MAQDCHGSDFVFPVPDDWVERSMIGYSAPFRPGRALAPNTLVAINQIPDGETLDSFVARQMDDLKSRAAGFAIKLSRSTQLDGIPCIEVVFAWHGGEAGRIQQRQVYAQRPGRRLVSITHTAPEAEFAEDDKLFVDMLAGFAWKKVA